MKHYTINFLNAALLLFLISSQGNNSAFAQKIQSSQVEMVLPGTKTELLRQLSQEFQKEEKRERDEAKVKALKGNWPLRMTLDDGTVYELIRFNGDHPEYYTTNNHIAAQSTSTNKVYPGGGFDYNLTGKGMIIGEWDEAAVLETHQELLGRVRQIDSPSSYSNHATHVAGTLMGAGTQPNAKGMAYEAELWAHDWNSDASEMAAAAANGLLVSNHSYGTLTGWANGTWGSDTSQPHWWGDPSLSEDEDYNFGIYNGSARNWDQIAYNAPYYLIVKSAGNDRGQNGALSHYVNQGNGWENVERERERDGGSDGYDCIPTSANAKNILTIGAVNDIPSGFNRPEDIVMSSFSGWGPTDDGRIKPDVVGNGVGLYSPTAAGNQSYSSYSGTSMSGPNVAGSLILLQELHQKYHGTFMRAATLKGLAIHTADSATGESRPDYRNGWGMLNTKKAADVLNDRFNHRMIEESIENNESYTYNVISDGVNPIKITLSWTDVQGISNGYELNSRVPRLVNDLDVRLYDSNNNEIVYLPFILDPENPSAMATNGDNILDNVEVIYANDIPAGSYTIVVTHKGTLTNERQDFSLIISSPLSDCSLTDFEKVMQFDLPCFGEDQLISFEIGEPLDGNAPFSFSLDNENYSESNSFEDLTTSHGHVVYIKDSIGCLGVVRIEINTPESINSSTEDEYLFEVSIGSETHEFNYSHAYNDGWGGNAWINLISGKPVLVDDGTADASLGCNTLVNTGDLEGNIAVVYRGSCEFGVKALNAQRAGAKAVIIINNEAGVISMAGGVSGSQVNIPVFMISNADGAILLDLMTDENTVYTIGSLKRLQPALCSYTSDGAINPKITGGSGTYSYHWIETGDTTRILENVPAGIYTLVVTDSNNCAQEFNYLVDAPSSDIEPQFQVTSETCIGNNDGTIRLISSNDNSYSLQFDGSIVPQNSSIINLSPKTYHIEFINIDGCVLTYEVIVGEGTAIPSIDQLIVTNESCEGLNDGSIVYSGNLEPSIEYIELFDSNQNFLGKQTEFFNLSAQEYSVVIASNTLCLFDGSITVESDIASIDPIISGPEEFKSEEPIEFNASPSDWDGTIEWLVEGGEIISGQGSTTVQVAFDILADAGELTVIFSKEECTFSNMTTVLNNINTSNRPRLTNENIKVFPNPSKDILYVEPINLNEKMERFSIITPLGEELMVVPFNNQKTEVNISNLPSGLYLIKVGNTVQKFSKI